MALLPPSRVSSAAYLYKLSINQFLREPPLRPSHRLHQLSFFVYIVSHLELFVKRFLKNLGYPRPFSRGSIIGKLASPPRLGFCILRIRDIVSACTVWFTFVFRTQEHRAVGSSEQGLTRSRGHPCHWVALPSPFVLLLYHRPFGLSRVFLIFFEERVGIRTH